MAIAINGSTNVITGVAVGGLPDAIVDADMLAANAVTAGKLASGVGGKILQVLQVGKTDTTSVQSSGNNDYSDIPNFSLAITPSSTSSKILVMVALTVGGNSGAFSLKLFRGSTEIGSPSSGTRPAMIHRYTAAQYLDSNIINFLDSPNTTSAITYKLQISTHGNAMVINRYSVSDDFTTASYLTLMEVGA